MCWPAETPPGSHQPTGNRHAIAMGMTTYWQLRPSAAQSWSEGLACGQSTDLCLSHDCTPPVLGLAVEADAPSSCKRASALRANGVAKEWRTERGNLQQSPLRRKQRSQTGHGQAAPLISLTHLTSSASGSGRFGCGQACLRLAEAGCKRAHDCGGIVAEITPFSVPIALRVTCATLKLRID